MPPSPPPRKSSPPPPKARSPRICSQRVSKTSARSSIDARFVIARSKATKQSKPLALDCFALRARNDEQSIRSGGRFGLGLRPHFRRWLGLRFGRDRIEADIDDVIVEQRGRARHRESHRLFDMGKERV